MSIKKMGDYILVTGVVCEEGTISSSAISRENMKEAYVWVGDAMGCYKIPHNPLIHTANRLVFRLTEIQYFSLNKRYKKNVQIL